MGWRGPYYIRSRRVGGRPRNEHVGAGLLGRAAAHLDELARLAREQERLLLLGDVAEVEALEDLLRPIRAATDDLVRAAFLSAGYHRHNREWRKRRVRWQED
jgi:hypothetical protein